MNDLYIHQLETENKQLREVLKSTNEVAKEYVRIEKHCDELQQRIDKAIELIKRSAGYKGICTQPETDTFSTLLAILGDKENEK